MMYETMKNGLARITDVLPALEEDLNLADAKIGDGDTGGMFARVIENMQSVTSEDGDLGGYFLNLSRAAQSATGSSLGNLISAALTAVGKNAIGLRQLEPVQLAELLSLARDAMLRRGGASLGDKTVIDAIHAIAEAVADFKEPADLSVVMIDAADEALINFRGRPVRIGRARMFGDASRGLDDPGMLAVAMFLRVALDRQ